MPIHRKFSITTCIHVVYTNVNKVQEMPICALYVNRYCIHHNIHPGPFIMNLFMLFAMQVSLLKTINVHRQINIPTYDIFLLIYLNQLIKYKVLRNYPSLNSFSQSPMVLFTI